MHPRPIAYCKLSNRLQCYCSSPVTLISNLSGPLKDLLIKLTKPRMSKSESVNDDSLRTICLLTVNHFEPLSVGEAAVTTKYDEDSCDRYTNDDNDEERYRTLIISQQIYSWWGFQSRTIQGHIDLFLWSTHCWCLVVKQILGQANTCGFRPFASKMEVNTLTAPSTVSNHQWVKVKVVAHCAKRCSMLHECS